MNIPIDAILFGMCIALPFTMMIALALHVVWRVLSPKCPDEQDYYR